LFKDLVFGKVELDGTDIIRWDEELQYGTQKSNPELHTNANAASDPNGNEADATTGFSQTGLDQGANVFASQGIVKNTGSYAIEANSNDTPTANAGFYADLEAAPFNLVDGKEYKLSFSARHVGSGGIWRFHLASIPLGTVPTMLLSLSSADTTFQAVEHTFTYSSEIRYINSKERNITSDGGVYFDNFSVKEVSEDLIIVEEYCGIDSIYP